MLLQYAQQTQILSTWKTTEIELCVSETHTNIAALHRGAYSDEKSLSLRVSGLTWPTRFAKNFGGYGIDIVILLQF